MYLLAFLTGDGKDRLVLSSKNRIMPRLIFSIIATKASFACLERYIVGKRWPAEANSRFLFRASSFPCLQAEARPQASEGSTFDCPFFVPTHSLSSFPCLQAVASAKAGSSAPRLAKQAVIENCSCSSMFVPLLSNPSIPL